MGLKRLEIQSAISDRQLKIINAAGKIHSIRSFIITAVLAAFGLLTTFLTSSIILDLFGIRAREGNYVMIVVLANLISGILFLTAAFAFFKRRRWATLPLIVSVVVLILGFFGLMIHIASGAAYETKTIGAMIFRITLNLLLTWLVYRTVKKQDSSRIVRNGIAVLLPLLFLVAACGQTEKDHDHATESEANHPGEGTPRDIQLNSGQKWEADEHTGAVVQVMKRTVTDFEQQGSSDYQALGDSLSHQLNILIKGCTMKGPAHDALHQWLGSLTPDIRELSRTSDQKKGSALKADIKTSLDTFDKTFE